MSLPTIVQPLIIVGPCILKWNGYAYYFKDGLKSDFKRDTWMVSDDFAGNLDERSKNQKTTLTGTPVGMVNLLTASSGKSPIFPYKPSQVGSLICGITGSPTPVVIQTQFGGASNTGQTITFVTGCMTKHAKVNLGSQKTLFEEFEFTCIGNPATANSASGSWNVIMDAAFADTTYDDTQIISDIYVAAYGSSPYAAMGAHNGFEIEIPLKFNDISSDDYGITGLVLDSMGPATAKFAPSSLTEAQVWTLLNAQGSAFTQPGMSLGAAGTSLIISGTGNGAHTLVATIPNAGPKDGGFQYDKKNNRVAAISFGSRRTFTTGAPNAIATFTVT